jgi:hypothetical protein
MSPRDFEKLRGVARRDAWNAMTELQREAWREAKAVGRTVAEAPVPTVKLGFCGDCDKEVSRLAKSCPHCGAPFPENQVNTAKVMVWGIVSALALLFAWAVISGAKQKGSELDEIGDRAARRY